MGYEKHFIYILKKYGFNCTHFHEARSSLKVLQAHLPYRISPKSVMKNWKIRVQINLRHVVSVTVNEII